jgi:TonB-dependent starch-binding outer membrane protein SusC
VINYPLPSITGNTGIGQNSDATIENSIWEFTLNSTNFRTNNFQWTTSLNVTIPKNKLVSYPNLEKSSFANTYIIGQPLGIIRVFKYYGVDPMEGLYQALDGHGNPTTNPPTFPEGYDVLINTLPKFYGGMENVLSYRSVHLEFLFQFVKQLGINDFYFNNSEYFTPGAYAGTFSNNTGYGNQPTTVLQRWQSPGDIRQIQKFSTTLIHVGNATGSDVYYKDDSFLKLKNITASWDISKLWLTKLRLQHLNVYLQAQNVLTITRYRGFDPENQSAISLPPLRTITAGIKLGF